MSEHISDLHSIMQKLLDEDQCIRCKAVSSFHDYLTAQHAKFTPEDIHNIFQQSYMYLLNTLRDPTERVREASIRVIKFFYVKVLPQNDFYIAYLIPILIERIGTAEVNEKSEELRLELLQLLSDLIDIYDASKLQTYVNDIVVILKEMLQDKYHSIKELCSTIALKLSHKSPQEMRSVGQHLIKPLVANMNFPRFRIRVASVHCIGEILLHTDSKSLQESFVPLAERLFDSIPVVRQSVAQVAGRWLLEHRDRYSYFHQILPLILTGLTDEVDATRDEAEQLWSLVGAQYQAENEEEFKEELNYLPQEADLYPLAAKRPNFGCRKLVQRHASKMIPALINELRSWKPDVRVRCAQLLCSMVLHTEDNILQNLPQLLTGMYSAARDDNSNVNLNVIRAAEMISCFIPASSWWKLVVPVLEASHHDGHLSVLAGLIRGAPSPLPSSIILEIAAELSSPYICYTRNTKNRKELMTCVTALQKQYHPDVDAIKLSESLFNIILAMVSTSKGPNGYRLNLLQDLQNVVNIENLWLCHTAQLLERINKDPKCWTEDTFESCIFQLVVAESRSAFGDNFEAIVKILLNALSSQVVPECRLQTFMALARALEMKDVCFENVSNMNEFMPTLITECFMPALVWHAGRIAEVMRTCAASCLANALAPGHFADLFQSPKQMRSVFDELMPLLVGLLEDLSSASRKLAIENVVYVKQNLVAKEIWTENDLLKIYPEMLKRFDDPVDAVRLCAIHGFQRILENPPDAICKPVYKAHHELIIDTLFVHLDDEDNKICERVLEMLKGTVNISAEMLVSKTAKQMDVIRNKYACMELLQYARKM